MKRFALLLFSGILLALLTSCSKAITNSSEAAVPSRGISSAAATDIGSIQTENHSNPSNRLIQVAPNVCFREGTSKDGSAAISADEIKGFYSLHIKSERPYQIVFQLTEKGQKSFAGTTAKLSKSKGCLSIWAGNKKVTSGKVIAPITEGNVAFTEPNGDAEKEACKELSAGY
jgi:hypothetical protein